MLRIPFSIAPLKREDYDDKPSYVRKPLSQKEGFRRLDKAMEKIAARENANSKVCDVCHRRTRAWRVVPAREGVQLSGAAGMFGKVLVCCDNGPSGCASVLTRAGVADEAIRERESMRRLGLILA
jgi:hypothetical protein